MVFFFYYSPPSFFRQYLTELGMHQLARLANKLLRSTCVCHPHSPALGSQILSVGAGDLNTGCHACEFSPCLCFIFFSTFTEVVSMIESEERNLSGGVELAVSWSLARRG